jgi:hypothetical protein
MQTPSIGQQHLAHQAAVAVGVVHTHGDGLLKREVATELPRSGAKGLRFLRGINAVQADADGFALAQHVQGVAVA